MRPPEFTGGNERRLWLGLPMPWCFNEAAGIHRRKLPWAPLSLRPKTRCFNEAAGIHRRKRLLHRASHAPEQLASMRPPEFTGGNP